MLALAATLAIQALAAMTVLTPPVFAALAAPEIGVDAHEIGFFTSIAYAAACVAAALSGGPVRRRGAIRVSQACLLFGALGIALCATAHLAPVLLGALFIGLGYGPMTPASSHLLIRQTPPHRRALVFSIKQTGVPLGGALAGLLVPPLVLALGWKGAALAVGVAGVALALLVEPLHRSLDDDADPASRDERRAFAAVALILRVPALRRLALASLAFAAVQLCFSAFIVTFLTERAGIDLVTAGLVMAVAQAAGIVGRVLCGWVADRLIPTRVALALLGLGMAAGAAAVALITAAWPLALVLLVTGLLGVFVLSWNGIFLAEVARLAPPGAAGAATGGTLSLTFLGVVIGPPLFSALVDWSGSYRVAFFAAAATAALAGLSIGRRAPAG